MNVLDFAGHVVSVTTQFYCCSVKEAIKKYMNANAMLFSNNLQKLMAGGIGATGYSLPALEFYSM